MNLGQKVIDLTAGITDLAALIGIIVYSPAKISALC